MAGADCENKMDTQLQNFYKNKNVFVTGGSGFLGIVYIEKLLRATEVNRVYILIRPKKGRTVDERIASMFKDILFERLLKLKPHAISRVRPVLGDCALPNLGLSSEDRQMLIDNVEIILHSAASVRFEEPLYNAIAINVRATLDLIELAKKMPKLKSFVHVSSAFANCMFNPIEERYYVDILSTSAEKISKVATMLGPNITNRLCAELRKPFPNTYTFTKALAEEAVLSQSGNLPICIFRPSIVVPIYKEPVLGWLGNVYGPSMIIYGVARGVLRIMYMHSKSSAHMVPVDYCANLMLATAWDVAKSVNQCPNTSPPIYNYAPDEQNKLTWSMYQHYLSIHGHKMPLTKMIWFPVFIATETQFMYKLLCFFYHTIPGYLYDFMLFLMGKKRRMVKLYRKIHHQTGVLNYFVGTHFIVPMENTKRLWKSLSPQDKKLFCFDMASVNWDEYFYNSLLGMRRFLGKEEPETIPKALEVHRKFKILHYGLQVVIFGILSALVLWMLQTFMA